MNYKDIILFIVILIVIYLLYKINKLEKEKFTSISTPTSISQQIIDEITRRITAQSNETITESIKNLGLLVRQIQTADGTLRLPANVVITGNLRVQGEGGIKLRNEVSIYENEELNGDRVHIRKDGNVMNVNNQISGSIFTLHENPSINRWASGHFQTFDIIARNGIKFGVSGNTGAIFSGGMNGGNNGLTVVRGRNHGGGTNPQHYKVINEPNSNINGTIYNNY